jgi:hypothetical protein
VRRKLRRFTTGLYCFQAPLAETAAQKVSVNSGLTRVMIPFSYLAQCATMFLDGECKVVNDPYRDSRRMNLKWSDY